MAMEYIDILKKKKIWDRWAHKRIREELDPGELFPNQTAVVFGSPSITLAFIQDMLLKRKPTESGFERRLLLASRGSGEERGPNCLVRHMLRRAAVPVLRTLLATLGPTAVTSPLSDSCVSGRDGGGRLPSNSPAAPCGRASAGAILVGLHVRRGDRAMYAECPTCVNQDDPDVKVPESNDRVQTNELDGELAHVNRSVTRLRRALGRDVLVFAASDTAFGLSRVKRFFGDAVLTVSGQAVHSTRTRGLLGSDAVKVAADFLGLAVSDVLFSIGSSSFSGNAAAMQYGVQRVPATGRPALRRRICSR